MSQYQPPGSHPSVQQPPVQPLAQPAPRRAFTIVGLALVGLGLVMTPVQLALIDSAIASGAGASQVGVVSAVSSLVAGAVSLLTLAAGVVALVRSEQHRLWIGVVLGIGGMGIVSVIVTLGRSFLASLF